MKKKEGRKRAVLIEGVLLIIALFGLSAQNSWAQIPTVVSTNPAANYIGSPINTNVTLQFSTSMNTGFYSFELEDEYGNNISGTTQWGTTSVANDTFIFTPDRALRYGRIYAVDSSFMSAGGIPLNGYGHDFEFGFITKPRTADVTPPTVQTVYPYSGMTGVSTTTPIYCLFSEPIALNTVNQTNFTLTGSGITGPSDYTVTWNFTKGMNPVMIKKNTPFAPSSTYTVTVTTGVRDLRGNPLKQQYQWSFTTGAADTTAPTVTQTIPARDADKVSTFSSIRVFFSEDIDGNTLLTPGNITLHDDTGNVDVAIAVMTENEPTDLVRFIPVYGTSLLQGHKYTVTMGTGVKDLAGNGLSAPYSWSFTTAGVGVDSAPVLYSDPYRDSFKADRWSDGSSRLDLRINAGDDFTNTLTITAKSPPTSPVRTWNLTKEGSFNYSYKSSNDEGLSPGFHTLRFQITDGAPSPNTITFDQQIFFFDSWPALSSPNNGETVSTTPTFQWSYGGSLRPAIYNVVIMNGPNPETALKVWLGAVADSGSGTQTLSIPKGKELAPGTTYYWMVVGQDFNDYSKAYSEIRSFTTGGTPYRSPRFSWARVRNFDALGYPLRGVFITRVLGPSPADIDELKVTGPGGFKYIFTEDNVADTEQNFGLFYAYTLSTSLPDGVYTFTVTDSIGRTVTTTETFVSASLPRVTAGMTPADNSYVNTTTPTFSWNSVGPGYYYRIRIFDWNQKENYVYASSASQETQVTVPEGVLFANTPYLWHVEVYADAVFPGRNRTDGEMFHFHTGNNPYTLTLNYAMVWSDNDHYSGSRKAFNTRVSGPLPTAISQMSVSGGFSWTFTQSNISWSRVSTGTQFSYSEPGSPASGSYNFVLRDNLDNVRNSTKNLSPVVIPIVEQESLSPANNSYISTLTPTLSWTRLGATGYYYRITITDWKQNYTIYQSSLSASTLDISSIDIPAGVLNRGLSFKWRVEVFDKSSTTASNGRSTSAWNCFTTPSLAPKVDFNGDGKPDIIWRNYSSDPLDPNAGRTTIWFMDGATWNGGYADVLPAVKDPNWSIVGVADFDGDGQPDLLWRNTSSDPANPDSGRATIWYMDGATWNGGFSEVTPTLKDQNWVIVGVADFNNDNSPDIVWRNISSDPLDPNAGRTAIWYMTGPTWNGGYAEVLPEVKDQNWSIVGLADFNGDGKTDLLWRNTSTDPGNPDAGRVAIWYMEGATWNGGYGEVMPTVKDQNWHILAIRDFDNDGNSDLVWRNTTSDPFDLNQYRTTVWFMTGATWNGNWGDLLPPLKDPNWTIVGR
jgi:methionine-rich copper-binding protein CopC